MRVVVTGAAGGIGSGVAETLDARGHDVIALDHDAERLTDLSDAIETKALDLRDGDAVRESLAGCDLDVVITCAGGYELAALEDTTPESFRRQLETNLTTVHTVVRATASSIRERNGRIVVVGSMVGSVALPYHGPYSAAKAGVRGYTEALRRELEPRGPTVALVEPGPVRTGLNERATAGLRSLSDAGSAYAEDYRDFEAYTPAATDVDAVVGTVVTAATTDRPRTRYRVSHRARWLPRVAAVLPDRLYDRLVRLGLPGGLLGRLIDS